MAFHANRLYFRHLAGFVASPGDLIFRFTSLRTHAANAAETVPQFGEPSALTTYAHTKHY
jgi:hypothetical protein